MTTNTTSPRVVDVDPVQPRLSLTVPELRLLYLAAEWGVGLAEQRALPVHSRNVTLSDAIASAFYRRQMGCAKRALDAIDNFAGEPEEAITELLIHEAPLAALVLAACDANDVVDTDRDRISLLRKIRQKRDDAQPDDPRWEAHKKAALASRHARLG